MFQFTRPHWGATCAASRSAPTWARFNSRARTGARPSHPAWSIGEEAFQFTRPHWGATFGITELHQTVPFQFTRPHWGATGVDEPVSDFKGFNSRARTGARLGN